MTTGSSEGSNLGRGRSLATPAFSDDDGLADPVVRRLLETGSADPVAVARALRSMRLLACVVAVADEVDESGADKSSHMAVVSMVNERGEKGLLAFTGLDSLAGWNPEARPVPSAGREVGRSAIEDGAEAVVIDVAGPHRFVLAGPALLALADDLDLDRVSALVQAALAPLTADGWLDAVVADVRPEQAAADVVVTLVSVGGGHPDGRGMTELAMQAARIVAGRADIQRLVPGGIGFAI